MKNRGKGRNTRLSASSPARDSRVSGGSGANHYILNELYPNVATITVVAHRGATALEYGLAWLFQRQDGDRVMVTLAMQNQGSGTHIAIPQQAVDLARGWGATKWEIVMGPQEQAFNVPLARLEEASTLVSDTGGLSWKIPLMEFRPSLVFSVHERQFMLISVQKAARVVPWQ